MDKLEELNTSIKTKWLNCMVDFVFVSGDHGIDLYNT